MEKMLDSYLRLVAETMRAGLDGAQRDAFRGDLLNHIRFFQHERLVHLIVMCLVAILAMLTMLCGLVIPNPWIWVLFLILVVLLGFYVRHYYHLENGVQKLYELYDQSNREREG